MTLVKSMQNEETEKRPLGFFVLKVRFGTPNACWYLSKFQANSHPYCSLLPARGEAPMETASGLSALPLGSRVPGRGPVCPSASVSTAILRRIIVGITWLKDTEVLSTHKRPCKHGHC